MTIRSRALAALRLVHLETPVRRGAARLRHERTERAERRRVRGIQRAFTSVLAHRVEFGTVAGAPSLDALPVVVCLWNRPERIGDVLRILRSQHTDQPLRLILWNNNPDDADHYVRAVTECVLEAPLMSIELHNSPRNIGGVARFVAIRELRRRGYRGSAIMIDDDQDFSPTLVDDLRSVAGPQAIAGVWAWTNTGDYWSRTQISEHGAPAMHIGTGGSIVDSAIVDDPAFFSALPARYLFMEDIWMSRYALDNGWRLTMASSPFEFRLSERDQGHAIFDHKEDFYSWLKEPGSVPRRLV